MNADMKTRLQKYMNEDGYYDVQQILMDIDKYGAHSAWSQQSQDWTYAKNISTEARAAREANYEKKLADEAAQQSVYDKLWLLTEKPINQLTDEEWQMLVDEKFAWEDERGKHIWTGRNAYPISEDQDGA